MGKERRTKRGNRDEDAEDDASSIGKAASSEKETAKEKRKKGRRAKDDDDDWLDGENETKESSKESKKKKDKKKGKHVDSDDEDVLNEKSKSVDADEDVKETKKKPKKSKKFREDDDDEFFTESKIELKDRKTKPKIVKPKSVFELLQDEGGDFEVAVSDDDRMEVDEMEEEEGEEVEFKMKSKKDEKKARKEKIKKEEDEELERMLAEIELGGKKEKKKKKEIREEVEERGLTIVTEIPEDEDDRKQRKKKKKKKDEEEEAGKKSNEMDTEEATGYGDVEERGLTIITEIPEEEEKEKRKKKKKKEGKIEEMLDEEEEEEGGTVKSAAQKKKEKKEREKQKKMLQKLEEKKKAAAEEEKEKTVKSKEVETRVESAEAVEEIEEVEDTKKKDKKKKTKEKVKEKEKEDKKRPGKKALLLMQEALKKIKEEEEKARLEEEARIRAAEEAERLRLEKLRLEQERKERRKQKEKEKRERLKAEGKLLTPAQKAQRARAQATLEALRAKGIVVPQIGEKKERTPRPGDRIRTKKSRSVPVVENGAKEAIPEQTAEPIKEEPEAEEKPVVVEETAKATSPEEDVRESWDQDSDADVKDTWDETTSEEEEDAEKNGETGKEIEKKLTKKRDESSSESESEESESESESETSSEESSEEDQRPTQEKIRERAILRIQKRREENESKRSVEKLRSPVVCVLGHVDTGKTKILDKIRHTHVQDSEAGGITQQIGATMVPIEAVREQSKMARGFTNFVTKLPGLLIIDTPGHESFSNLRSRGSSLCDIAILVVDLMHGLEPQTIESINLLKQRKTPFVVALNKIDRLYEWKPNKHKDVQDTLKGQNRNTQLEFEERVKSVILQFAEQSLNAKLFYENQDFRTFISLVPTSAHTGDGMGNLMALIVELTQSLMAKKLSFSEELLATVLEVKAIPGLGTTIDVILVNGFLKEGDTIVLAGTEGPVVTQIRSLLMPQPLKELRVKNPYQEFKIVEGAQGVKVAAKDFEKSMAGLNLLVAHHPDEVEICKEEVSKELQAVMSSIKLAERGVYVQASTLGSLEALLEFLRTSNIPYAGIRIGPVVKKDVMKASTMHEHDSQYAVILAFDVKIERDAQELADQLAVKIFAADIIYHLFDKFKAYRDDLFQKKRDQHKHIAIFPCKLRILPQFIFNTRDPIIVGVSVEAGVVKEGTPLCVPSRDFLDIGIVSTIESNHKTLDSARKGQEVCIKIEPVSGEAPKLYGRHFEHTDPIVSKISRQSIDACKEYFRDDLQKTDWQLMVELKKMFQIV